MSVREYADLRLTFRDDGRVDLDFSGSDLDTVSGVDNLRQALEMRLLVRRGELSRLGHPQYGGRLHELVGEPLDRPLIQLMRRFVRQTLLADPRVAAIAWLDLRLLKDHPGAVEVEALIEPASEAMLGPALQFGVILDVDG